MHDLARDEILKGFGLTESLSRDIMPFVPCYGLLAQLVEHIVHIDGVTGSSPVQTTEKIPPLAGGILLCRV